MGDKELFWARLVFWAWLSFCAAATLACLVGMACGAPRPSPRKARPPEVTRARLVGTWQVRWGAVPTTFVLSANGAYVCKWCGTEYVGSWGLRDGRLWITETMRPESATDWQHYAIRLDPMTLSGPIEVGTQGTGSQGVSVRLERRQR